MLHIILRLLSNQILKIFSELIVCVNVTHNNITVILKLNMKNLEWHNCLCKCYTSYHCYTQVSIKNLEWDECLCKCYTSYHCYSQSKYKKSWVRWMFM
jgi:hypothetical protein